MVRKNNGSAMPDSPEALANFLADPRLASAVYGGESHSAVRRFQAAYAAAVEARDPGIAAQLRGQLGGPHGMQLAMAGQARPGNAMEGLYRPGAAAAKLDGVFAGIGDFVQALRKDDARLGQVREVMNSFGSEVPADGGLLIPEELRSELVLHSLESAIIRPRALNVPMGTLRTGVPAIDDVSHASSIMGNFVAYWVEESAQLTESQAVYERIFLDAKKLLAFCSAPNELIADAPAFDLYLRTVIPAGMAWYEDQGLIRGTGAGEPLGVINSPCAIQVTRNTSSKVLFADVIAMLPRMLPASLTRCVWMCSPDVLTQLLQIYLLIGTVPTSAAVPPSDWLKFRDGQWELLGLPLFPTEHVPALGTTGDLILFDPGMYLLGTRALMQMDISPHPKFNMDVSEIRVRSRVDGRMWPQSPLTPANSSQTVSAVVVLN